MKYAWSTLPTANSAQALVVSLCLQLQDDKATPFDPAAFSRPNSGGALDSTDASKVEAVMKAFCGLYDEADVDAVPDVLSEDFYEVRKPGVLANLGAVMFCADAVRLLHAL